MEAQRLFAMKLAEHLNPSADKPAAVRPLTVPPDFFHAHFDGRTSALQGTPSALSQLDFRVERLEFTAGVADFHLPVDAALGGVGVD